MKRTWKKSLLCFIGSLAALALAGTALIGAMNVHPLLALASFPCALASTILTYS